MRGFRVVISSVVAMALAGAMNLAAQEHPEEEHPSGHAVAMADLEQAIHQQIIERTKAEGGRFHVHDPVLNKHWALELVRIHTDKLTQLDKDTYFACTDFRADDGEVVDVDFYMKDEHGKLVFSDTAIHKIDGKPRFTYEKKDGFWGRIKPAS